MTCGLACAPDVIWGNHSPPSVAAGGQTTSGAFSELPLRFSTCSRPSPVCEASRAAAKSSAAGWEVPGQRLRCKSAGPRVRDTAGVAGGHGCPSLGPVWASWGPLPVPTGSRGRRGRPPPERSPTFPYSLAQRAENTCLQSRDEPPQLLLPVVPSMTSTSALPITQFTLKCGDFPGWRAAAWLTPAEREAATAGVRIPAPAGPPPPAGARPRLAAALPGGAHTPLPLFTRACGFWEVFMVPDRPRGL